MSGEVLSREGSLSRGVSDRDLTLTETLINTDPPFTKTPPAPTVDRMTDTREKYYFAPQTKFAGGKNCPINVFILRISGYIANIYNNAQLVVLSNTIKRSLT